MTKPSKPKPADTITPVSFKSTLEEKYLAYALSTITARSLPDVRDGLKPVHRRLLYAMLQLKLDPKSGYKKCARVVGDVIGKYHPHGDLAVYEAMVRLAQTFAVRYTLVEGQGNFGSVDGDNPAAMRYTEARLTDVAMALLDGIDEDTVNFRPTYDGSEDEPVVLPAAFPNLLANGSEGIAVGMATSIPPHNAGELCDALLYLIEHPDCKVKNLVTRVPGPDFPTGGLIVEPAEAILAAYETGRGGVRIRAKWEKQDLSHGMYQIVVSEIPYQVPKSRLIENIAELFREKKLPLLGNIRDESAEDIRIVLEPKSRAADPGMLMESLFKITDLEARFNMNLNVLDAKGAPRVMNLKDILQSFLDHRLEVLKRRTGYRLDKIAHRLEILEGLLIAYLNLDEVIRIIRREDEPKPLMMKKWNLTDVQAEAILNTRLRSLRKLEEMEIKGEHGALSKEQKELKALLKSEEKCWLRIADEIKDIKLRFGGKNPLGRRRTQFADAPVDREINIEAFVEKEPITILYSKMGWLRATRGHGVDLSDIKYKEGDEAEFQLEGQTTDKLLLFSTDGRFYTLPCDKIPKGKGQGEPVRLMIDLDSEADIVAMQIYNPESTLLVASSGGKGFIVEAADVEAQTKNGKQILNVPPGRKASACIVAAGDHVAVIGENRKLLIFPLSQLPVMKKGQGVTLQKYKDGAMSDVKVFTLKEGLSWTIGAKTRVETSLKDWVGNRADAGRLPPQGFPKTNRFS
ncbi:MAG: DNA topoisomerase IV subunit A [Pseudomonadota bacterium]|nr:DNA topoisomerase IV subunit A [Pseudomonadota bacterium]MDE3037316.1 DNA topoisomerase IV subunit A [Pseudomonadota bacterium]